LLADVVVQLARDTRALGFLGRDEPCAEIVNALVAGAQLFFASPDLPLGLSPPRPLNEHTGDQRGLREEERRHDEDVELVALPGAGLTKPDEGAWGNARFADVPSLKLAPVELIGIEIPRRHGDAVSPLAAQHPDR